MHPTILQYHIDSDDEDDNTPSHPQRITEPKSLQNTQLKPL